MTFIISALLQIGVWFVLTAIATSIYALCVGGFPALRYLWSDFWREMRIKPPAQTAEDCQLPEVKTVPTPVWWRRMFQRVPIHFHTMQEDQGPVCGVRGGEIAFTREELHKVTCPGCLAWLSEHPDHPKYINTRHWLGAKP